MLLSMGFRLLSLQAFLYRGISLYTTPLEIRRQIPSSFARTMREKERPLDAQLDQLKHTAHMVRALLVTKR